MSQRCLMAVAFSQGRLEDCQRGCLAGGFPNRPHGVASITLENLPLESVSSLPGSETKSGTVFSFTHFVNIY